MNQEINCNNLNCNHHASIFINLNIIYPIVILPSHLNCRRVGIINTENKGEPLAVTLNADLIVVQDLLAVTDLSGTITWRNSSEYLSKM